MSERISGLILGVTLAFFVIAAYLAYQDHVLLTRICARAGNVCAATIDTPKEPAK